jgi:hypothetical protein
MGLRLNENLPPYTATAPCDVHFVVGRYGVKVIEYTLTRGAALPLGQSCGFAVERCLST